MMDNPLDRYLVFGNPIAQSKSPFIHTLFAQQTQQKMSYQAKQPHNDEFLAEVAEFFEEGGKGCNVTAPYKEQAFQFATRLTHRAELAGSVNTLKRLDDGEIIGDTTDGEGLVQDLLNNHVQLEGARILIIGAGGAARGVIRQILGHNPKELVIANRTFDKAQILTQMFEPFGNIKAVEIEKVNSSFDLVINSTSASLYKTVPDISSAIFSKLTVSYDMSYGSGLTTFNAWAKDEGAVLMLDGLGMLVGQAAESFMLWRGIRPGTKQILRELRRNLEG